MSLKAFALATLVEMIPPTYALTYFGSSVLTMDWPLILAGVVLIIVFLFLLKWIMNNPSTQWVRLIQGERPKGEKQKKEGSILKGKAPSQCSWCAADFKGE